MSVSPLFDATEIADRPMANPVATAFAAVAAAVTAWRAERARRVALLDLMGMEPHRLRDLGISAHDVRRALAGRG